MRLPSCGDQALHRPRTPDLMQLLFRLERSPVAISFCSTIIRDAHDVIIACNLKTHLLLPSFPVRRFDAYRAHHIHRSTAEQMQVRSSRTGGICAGLRALGFIGCQVALAHPFGSEAVDFHRHQSYCVWHENTQSNCVPTPEAAREPLLPLAE
jgi:hypothetical protein